MQVLSLILDILEDLNSGTLPQDTIQDKIYDAKALLLTTPTVEVKGIVIPDTFKNVHGFTEALGGWIQARRKKRNPPTDRAIQILINRLSERPSKAVAALDMATERGWSTIKWDWYDRENEGGGDYEETGKMRVIQG
jgi:hypothetical protein